MGGTCDVITPSNPQGITVQDPQLNTVQTQGIQTEEQTTTNETSVSVTETTTLSNIQAQIITWTATATSNPFEHSFKVNLSGAEAIDPASSFTAQLTDMSGKVYTLQALSKEQIETEHFGQNLAPGMYMLTLSQGTQMQVLRVVKR